RAPAGLSAPPRSAPAPPARFPPVAGSVRRFEEIAGLTGLHRRGPDGDGDVSFATLDAHGLVAEPLEDRLRLTKRGFLSGAGHEDSEFVAAPPRRRVFGPLGFLQNPTHVAQRRAAARA